jgi:hypothetical protein
MLVQKYGSKSQIFLKKLHSATLTDLLKFGPSLHEQLNIPRADGAKRRARVLIPPGYLHPGKRKR